MDVELHDGTVEDVDDEHGEGFGESDLNRECKEETMDRIRYNFIHEEEDEHSKSEHVDGDISEQGPPGKIQDGF